jgi:hypothetical protein
LLQQVQEEEETGSSTSNPDKQKAGSTVDAKHTKRVQHDSSDDDDTKADIIATKTNQLPVHSSSGTFGMLMSVISKQFQYTHVNASNRCIYCCHVYHLSHKYIDDFSGLCERMSAQVMS